MYFVYFAKSLKNGKVYVGYTQKQPEQRVAEHNSGSSSWSRVNRPLKLIYYEKFVCKDDALSREKFYKSGVGKQVKLAITKVFEKGSVAQPG